MVCIMINACAAAAVLCCVATPHRGWVGWCVSGLLGRWVGGWGRLVGQYVDDRVCSLLWVFDVFRTSFFRFLDPSWWFHRSLSTSIAAVYVICCTPAVIHGGWVDRFVGVSVVLRSAILLPVSG